MKSNLGHTQAAAGAAGIIKMVLAMQHGLLPPTLHVDEPSPYIDWSAGDVRLLAEPVPWPADVDRPRRAGVSAFGISGTNAHVILEEPPAAAEEAARGQGTRPLLDAGLTAWVVSGRTAGALSAQAARLAAHLAARPDLDPADVAWSLAATRSVFEHRAVITGADREELAAGLAAVAAGGRRRVWWPGRCRRAVRAGWCSCSRARAASGRGWAGSWPRCCPVFAARLARVRRGAGPARGLGPAGGDRRCAGAPGLESAAVAQPALWAVMVSLAAVWQAAGVTPDAVLGHSQGEIAAATVAGILTLEDAARVVASAAGRCRAGYGGRHGVGGDARDGGAGAAVPVGGPAVGRRGQRPRGHRGLGRPAGPGRVRGRTIGPARAALAGAGQRLRGPLPPGGSNSPRSWPWSWPPSALRRAHPAVLHGDRRLGRRARAGRRVLVRQCPADRPVRRRGPGAGRRRYRIFVEVSAHPVLTAAITETAQDADAVAGLIVSGTCDREDAGAARLLSALAEPASTCTDPGGLGRCAAASGQRVDLPTYAFQHQLFWPEPPSAPGDVAPVAVRPDTEGWRYRDLLGAGDRAGLGAAVRDVAGGGPGRTDRRAGPLVRAGA